MHIVPSYAKIVNFMGLPPSVRKHRPQSEWREFGIEAVRYVEEVARTCYRSEGGMSDESYIPFLRNHFLASGHTNMARFSMVVVEFMVDRGIAQEILRHLATLVGLHESQRFCNYSKDKFDNSVGFIKPRGLTPLQDATWMQAMGRAERAYFELLESGLKPQIAADALPRASAGKVTLAGPFQAWRHFLLVRTTEQCHPKLLDVTCDRDVETEDPTVIAYQQGLLGQFQSIFPVFFDDIKEHGQYIENVKKVR